ncbi:acyl carrier protein [Arsenicibacter rosenii]|uniref:Acyl carrier protein n=1 Tax=Arsenicibacter rosenii TaxID=1750698 RepID=A0A1S2VFS8_9BACT|nr:acyl carrier protein [Arsenicibacter rosenii]OIN57066.1 hypothetical protein BLX24_21115 [Arsenicibacter rosenii]
MNTRTIGQQTAPIAEIERILTRKLFVRPGTFRPDYDLFRHLHLFRTDFLELLNYVEDRFRIELHEEEVNQVRTARQLSDLVLQHLEVEHA